SSEIVKAPLRLRNRLALVAGAENHVPQSGGHAEVGVRVVVMDVVEAGPATHHWALESVDVDHDVAQAISRVTRRDGAGQQQGVAYGDREREQQAQRTHEKRRHEEWQRVITERIVVMVIVAGLEWPGVAVEQPAVRGVFDEGEDEESAQRRQRSQRRLHPSVPDSCSNQQYADHAVTGQAGAQIEVAGGQARQWTRNPLQRRGQARRWFAGNLL